MTAFEGALVECACLDAEHDAEPDSVRAAYLASKPHDPSDPAMAELRAQVERWVADPDRVFAAGADVRGWMGWHSIVIDALSAGELVRLAAVLKVFEGCPIEAATVHTDALWAVVGSDGHRNAVFRGPARRGVETRTQVPSRSPSAS